MKLIHTSDWHLGARLHDQDRGEEHDAFLAFLRGLVRAERPDALVVAGDVFDVRQPTPAAQRRYYQFIADLRNDGACGRLILIAGNHDSAALLAAPKELLAQLNATVVARRRSRFGSGSPPMSGRPSPTPPPSAPPTGSAGRSAGFAR